MKYLIRNSGAVVLIFALLLSCIGSSEKRKEESLSIEEKALNTIKNTTIVFMGLKQLVFSRRFKEQTNEFSSAFSNKFNDITLAKLDKKIEAFGEEPIQTLEELIRKTDSIFDELAENKLSFSEKMSLLDIMREGVEITEKYELPYGFRPLSQNLSETELKRYIFKVTSDMEKKDDPIIKTFQDLHQWQVKFNSDPQMRDLVKSIQY